MRYQRPNDHITINAHCIEEQKTGKEMSSKKMGDKNMVFLGKSEKNLQKPGSSHVQTKCHIILLPWPEDHVFFSVFDH